MMLGNKNRLVKAQFQQPTKPNTTDREQSIPNVFGERHHHSQGVRRHSTSFPLLLAARIFTRPLTGYRLMQEEASRDLTLLQQCSTLL